MKPNQTVQTIQKNSNSLKTKGVYSSWTVWTVSLGLPHARVRTYMRRNPSKVSKVSTPRAATEGPVAIEDVPERGTAMPPHGRESHENHA